MEQPVIPGQDPVQQTQAPAPAAEPAAPAPAPAAPQQYQSTGPWAQDLQQAFSDPQLAADVDAFLRSKVQPHMTKLEQQYAETENARQLYEAYEADAEAANIAVNRQLYGDDYANQMAASLGRTDLLTQPVGQPQQAVQPQQAAEPQQPALPPEYQEMYNEWAEQRQQQAYDDAKSSFLSDPQYADINPDLFDPFVAGATTWEEAVGSYRAYAANFAQNGNSNEQPAQPPPALGSTAVGAPGSTPSYPVGENLNDAIDAIFSENKPLPPPTLGNQ